eukprot:3467221-Prymnesium_polylepis.1
MSTQDIRATQRRPSEKLLHGYTRPVGYSRVAGRLLEHPNVKGEQCFPVNSVNRNNNKVSNNNKLTLGVVTRGYVGIPCPQQK